MGSELWPVLLALPAAGLLSAVLVGAARRWAQRREILDIPDHRSSHVLPTPRGGGVGIVAAVALGWCCLPLLGVDLDIALLSLIGGALLVALVSLAEDITRSVGILLRLLVHALASGVALLGLGLGWAVALPWLAELSAAWWTIPLLILWGASVTNLFNFMDGIDGIAGIQAAVAGVGWLLLGQMCEAPAISYTGGLIAAGSLGFLAHNWPPARIFMGDVGSTFLGFTLGMLCVLAAAVDPLLPFSGALLLWPFLFDGTFTLLRRAIRGEHLLSPHRTHLYQRLVIAGCSHKQVSSLYGLLAASGLLLALAWQKWGASAAPLVVGTTAALACLLWLGVAWRERRAKLA